jgi:quinol monooxygenase YgiN
MPVFRRSLALVAIISTAASAAARAETMGSLTFIEVRAEAQGHAANVLREQASALRERTPSPAQVILVEEIARPERFVLLEREVPAGTVGGAREKDSLSGVLADDLTAPPDWRANREFAPDPGSTATGIDARNHFYVIAHLDLATPDPAKIATTLHQLAAAARRSDGNQGFMVWQQTEHPNHFNLVSGWTSESALHSFESTRAARDFRQTVAPLLGSPYDERLFRRVD